MRRTIHRLTIVLIAASTALPSAAQEAIRLAPGDAIAFSALGSPGFDREVTVGSDGSIYLPIGGKFVVLGLTIAELREQVYAALSDRAYRLSGPNGEEIWRRLQENELFLEVAEYRPVYVTGAVVNPGEVRFRQGMSVRQALAVAGGVGRAGTGDSEQQVLRLVGERALLQDGIALQVTNIERLKNDLDAVLAPPPVGTDAPETAGAALPGGNSPKEIEDLARRWLDARADLRGATSISNELVLSRMESRLGVLEQLDAVSQERLQLETEEYARAEEAAEFRPWSNLAAATARRGYLESSTRALETASEVLRLKLDIERFSEEVKAGTANEHIRLLEVISDATANLQSMQRRLDNLDAELMLLSVSRLSGQKVSVATTIFRGGTEAGEPAAPATIMAPGDVLEVMVTLDETPAAIR